MKTIELKNGSIYQNTRPGNQYRATHIDGEFFFEDYQGKPHAFDRGEITTANGEQVKAFIDAVRQVRDNLR